MQRSGCVGFLLCLLLLCYALVSLHLAPTEDVVAALVRPVSAVFDRPVASNVLGRPSLTPAFMRKVLVASHSPAVGTEQALYNDSLRYGIDDAYALAFFLHESSFGTAGVARATLSLGNIRCSLGYRCIEGYRAYDSWQAGYKDWYALIKCGYVGACTQADVVSRKCPCVTVEQIIPVYAPASDHNNEVAYIAAVLSAVAAWRRGRVWV